MKTTVLLTVMVLTGLTSANATTLAGAPQGEDTNNPTRNRYAEPILFMERGVEFLIFPDGSFDFNTNPGNAFNDFDDTYYRRGTVTNNRRGSVNTTQGAPGTMSHGNHLDSRSGGIIVQHDFDGKVRRIGNLFINYDGRGKVKRVGTIYMNYNRGGLLSQVGGLRLTYNHWGEIVHSHGVINAYNMHHTYGVGNSNGYAYGHNNHYDTDTDYYYYKKGDKIKKQKKIKK